MQPRSMALPTKRWWVFFVPMERQHWYRPWYWLIPGYQAPFHHCYAACEAGDNVVTYMDPQNNGLQFSVFLGRPKQHIDLILRKGGRVLYVERPDWNEEFANGDARYRRGWTITCASVIAYAMALDTRVQTPRGLYDLLLRDYGALELERSDGRRRRRRRRQEQAAGAAPGGSPGGRAAAE